MLRRDANQPAGVREGGDPSQVRDVASVGEVALGALEQRIETSFRIRFHAADRDTLATQPGSGERNEQTLRRDSLGCEIGQSPIHRISRRKRQIGEAPDAEPCRDPPRGRGLPGGPAPLGSVGTGGAGQSTASPVAAESLTDLDGELHKRSICSGGKHCKRTGVTIGPQYQALRVDSTS